jgi:hypothetical protein
MRRWLVRRLLDRGYQSLRDGEFEPILRQFRPDARVHFAGTHSWAIDSTDPAVVRAWFERFAALRPELSASDVLVNGPPWRMSVCVVFDDGFRDHSGQVIYRNHGVQYLQLRWGRVMLDEINLDTQRVADYDVAVANTG